MRSRHNTFARATVHADPQPAPKPNPTERRTKRFKLITTSSSRTLTLIFILLLNVDVAPEQLKKLKQCEGDTFRWAAAALCPNECGVCLSVNWLKSKDITDSPVPIHPQPHTRLILYPYIYPYSSSVHSTHDMSFLINLHTQVNNT